MKLHELLAVENGLETQSNKVRSDLVATFEKKRHLFEEKRVVFIPNEEGKPTVIETQSDIQSTVTKELKWLAGYLTKSLDASYQVAETNTAARADIVLEGDNVPLVAGVPATALLELEKRLAEIQALVTGIPTLDPAKGFSPDAAREAGIYKAREVTKTRTQKVKDVLVLYHATKEHPAQTKEIDLDKPTGKLQEQEWSGLLTPAAKADLINRVEIVARAVRQARSRANDAMVDTDKKIASRLLNYILG